MSKQWEDVFAANRNRRARMTYGIAFTPRSGSSWLSEILAGSNVLGNPVEWFNPSARRGAAELSDCDNLLDYFDYLERTRTLGGIFSFEITWNQLRRAIDAGCVERFEAVRPWFFLRRRRFLRQAVSLYRAEHSGRFHSSQELPDTGAVPYNGAEIARSVLRLMHQEAGFSAWFAQQAIKPLPLWYEDLISLEPRDVVLQVGQAIGAPAEALRSAADGLVAASMEKLPAENTVALIQRFRQEHPDFLAYWQRWRGEHHLARFRREQPRLAAIANVKDKHV